MSAGRLIPLWVPVPFLLLSGGCYCLVAEVDTLTCDRSADVCTVTRAKPLGATTQSFAVEDLKGAEVGSGGKPGGTAKPSTGKRVLFITKQETIPFMNYTTDLAKAEMEEQAAAVARYVASPTTRHLEFRRDNRTSSLLIAAIPFALSVAIVLGLNRLQRAMQPDDTSAAGSLRPS
jgi:hypothetical protein